MKNSYKIKKVILIIFLSIIFLVSIKIVKAENLENKEKIFKAKVLKILSEEKKEIEGERVINQQNLLFIGLEGDYIGKEVVFEGIGNIEIISNKTYKEGDKVFLLESFNSNDSSYSYYIVESYRSGAILFIVLIFVVLLVLIGRWKGFRSIISLLFTFFVIIFYILPKIMSGLDPVATTLMGSIFILVFVIYLTEGFNSKSHIAATSTFITLLFVVFISWLFIFLGKLSGAFGEDVFMLLNIGQGVVNFKGILLAGIIIGALGVIDDVVISQVVLVEQIIESNPYQDWKEVYSKAYKVGVSHIASMTNTLFLAYAGASLPLLILFISPDNPFISLEQIINSEAISTEIIRALSGSIGIILSVPLSTFLASWFFLRGKKRLNK